jgi:hypothetical protein
MVEYHLRIEAEVEAIEKALSALLTVHYRRSPNFSSLVLPPSFTISITELKKF